MYGLSDVASFAPASLASVSHREAASLSLSLFPQVGTTALLFACRGGHLKMVQWLIREAGSDARSERGDVRVCACVCVCVRVGRAGMRAGRARLYWTACAVVQRDRTALLSACEGGHLVLAQWLVRKAGSDVRSERTMVRRVSLAIDSVVIDRSVM